MAIYDCTELHKKYGNIGKKEIEEHALRFLRYDVNISMDKVQNKFDDTCQGTVPFTAWVAAMCIGQ